MESVPIENVVLPSSSAECFDCPISKVLENEYILLEISTYLSTPDLKTFRLVNWKWNKICTPVTRSKFPKVLIFHAWELIEKDIKINFTDGDDEDNFYKKEMENAEMALERLTNLIQNSVNGFPCARFHISTEIMSKCKQNDKARTNFIRVISSFATEITFSIGKNRLFFQNPETAFEFPNLKSLSVLVGRLPYDYHEDTFLMDLEDENLNLAKERSFKQNMNFIKSVLQNAPNLQNVRFATSANLVVIKFLKIFGRVENINKVKNLDLCGIFRDTHFAKLAEMPLTLEKLTLFFVHGTSFQAHEFQSFLETQSASLKELCIDCHIRKNTLPLRFPQMKKLTDLKIQNDYNSRDTGLSFPDLSLVSSFPVLKNFAHACGPFNLANFFNSSVKPVISVDTLELPLDLYDENDSNTPKNDDVNIPDIILEAGRIFPNLKHLKVLGKHDVMLAVAAYMGQVEKLTLCGPEKPNKEMNQVLTGYLLEEMANMDGYVGNKSIRGPLSLLHSIKVLKLEHAKVSDWICRLGPLKMQGLECLDLSSLNCKLLESNRNNGVNKEASHDDEGDNGDDDGDDEDESKVLELTISAQMLAEMRQMFLVLTNELFAPE